MLTRFAVVAPFFLTLMCGLIGVAAAADPPATTPTEPAGYKVYVPYDKLKGVFESEKQGVFLPYAEFERLWQAAQGSPAGVGPAPVPYLVSTARFNGKVGAELADLQLELTVDILSDDWVQVPLGLGEVAVVKAAFVEETPAAPAAGPAKGPAKIEPLLRVVDGQYLLMTKGKGRRVLKLDFVRQLVARPGLNVLSFKTPAAAMTTLDLLIPEENMKVDVTPMLAATTTQVTEEGKKATKLQAFLGAGGAVEMSWKPTTQADEKLTAVVIADQLQSINVAEALITYDAVLNYDIRRRGVDAFTVQLPGGFRVTAVDGANISKWDISGPPGAAGDKVAAQALEVKLFSPAKDRYTLTIKMERFLQESTAQVPLTPIITQQALRQTGLIAIAHSPRRSVEVRDAKDLARVDVGRLPDATRNQPGVVAYRFITTDYSATMAIDVVEPRITVQQLWALGVQTDRLELQGNLGYEIDRVGVFQLSMDLPDAPVPWKVISVGPSEIVDSHQVVAAAGKGPRQLNILLKREMIGRVNLVIKAEATRPAADAPVDFALPLANAKDLQLYSGQLVLLLPEQLRAEIDKLDQFNALPLNQAAQWTTIRSLAPAMAAEFRAVDRAKPAGAKFKIALKPTQISAVVNRLVNIQPGNISQQAVVQYRVLYAPVDTFYLKMPPDLAKAVEIAGAGIKEKQLLNELPADQRASSQPEAETSPHPALSQGERVNKEGPWAYYKVVLQAPVIGNYELNVTARRAFQAAAVGAAATVVVEPILAAGKLSDQNGFIAVAKADSLALGEPKTSKNLLAGDPSSAADLPYGPHRAEAALAFKYNAPPFELSLPVVTQSEAEVFTVIATAAVVEQALARDGTLNSHVTYLLKASRGDRLPISLPAGAKLLGVLLNGAEAPTERTGSAEQWIVRLPPSAGQVAKLVLEVTCQAEHASAAKLAAPALPEKIPVQQTLWRLSVPTEDVLLKYDRGFAAVGGEEADELLTGRDGRPGWSAGFPVAVTMKLAGQGQSINLLRQGAPGTLAVVRMPGEAFSIAVWLAVLAVGLVLLPLGGLARSMLVLLIVLGGLVLELFAPLAAARLFYTGQYAALIVLALWCAQWLFVRRNWRLLTPPPKAKVEGRSAKVEGTKGTSKADPSQGVTP